MHRSMIVMLHAFVQSLIAQAPAEATSKVDDLRREAPHPLPHSPPLRLSSSRLRTAASFLRAFLPLFSPSVLDPLSHYATSSLLDVRPLPL